MLNMASSRQGCPVMEWAVRCPCSGGEKAQVGLVHNWLRYEPLSKRGYCSFYINPLCSWMDEIWANRIMIEYFTTGQFTWRIPFGAPMQVQEDIVPPVDWIGMNYYGRYV